MASTQKNVDLVIRARDETRRALQSAKSALDGFAAAQARTAARRGQFAALEKEAREVDVALDAASKSAAELGRKLGLAKRPTQAMKAEFAAARAEAKRLKDEIMGVAVAGGRMNGRVGNVGSFAQFDQGIVARQGADQAAFDELARGARTADAALENLARDLPPVAAVQDRLAASTNRATAALNAQARAGRGGDFASRVTGAAASRNSRGPLGLRPWEMQNLGYQVNDVITGLISGQRPMQVIAQQGGQIAQLFPQAVAAILRMVPVLALVTAAVAPFVAALGKASDQAKNLKEFELLLTRSGEAASYTAPKLAALADDLDNAGASADGARAAFSEFVNDSVDPEYLRRFGDTAQDVSKVLGIDLVDAAKKVSDAFTGDADAILSLDDELNFLTDTERKHIELLRKSKRDAEARTEAFAIFERRYGETADKMRGPWSSILNNFGDSWDALVSRINEIDFSAATTTINALIGRLTLLTSLLPGASGPQGQVDRATRALNEARTNQLQVGRDTNPNNSEGRIRRSAAERFVARRERELVSAQTSLALSRLRDGTDPLQIPTSATPRPQPRDTTLDPPAPANSGGRDRVTDQERLAKLQKEFNEDLTAQNAARAQDIVNLQVAERQLEINTALEQARAKAVDDGLTFSDGQAAAIRTSVGALFDARVEQEGFNAVSAAALELAERRGETEERAAYITRRLALERLTIETAIGRARADQLGQAYDLDQKARDLANSEKSVNDLLTRRTELQSQLTFADEQGDVAGAEALRNELESVNAHLLLAVNNSILFWQSIGGPEAAAAILVLEGYRKGIEAAGKAAIVTGKQIDDMIAQGGVNAFNDFWDAVGQGANAFESARDAFLSFAADFLKQIANMILQQTLLNALQSTTGGKGGKGGGIGQSIASAIVAAVRHNGGLAGGPGRTRMMPAALFASASRYHSGGLPGLKSNEVATILEDTEGVFTKEQMSALAPAGSGGSVKVVNVFDPAELLDRALATSAGERVFLNFVSRNSAAFKVATR